MNTQQEIERSIFEALRLKALSLGVTPDITTYPDTSVGYNAYLLALKAIEASKGYALEIFGNSSILAKGQVRTPRIVIDWGGYIPNDIGNSPVPVFTENIGGSFDKNIYDMSSDKGFINIILVSETVAQERMLQDILKRALPSRAFVPFVNTSYGTFLVIQESAMKTSSYNDATKEWVYSYSIPDIFWDVSKSLGTAPKITSYEVNSYIVDRLGISHHF
jgi:hypothetical protein